MKVNADEFEHLEDLDAESKYLVHRAKDATQYSYSPYSKFQVGAAVILEDGEVLAAANQENASYPLCMCAERIALYMAANLHPGKQILKMAVVAHKKYHKEITAATSCGACRQVMLEFENKQDKPIEVVMYGANNKWFKFNSVAALLPLAFTRANLG
jgi:cytidine deaminase